MKRMIEIIMLIERMMNEKVGSFNYVVKVQKSTGAGRKKYLRNVVRQTTLDEFADIDGEAQYRHPKTITYTVHPSHMRADNLNDLIDDLVKDLDIYLHEHR
jgi:predicted ATPase